MSAGYANRRGRPRQSSVRNSSLQLDSRNLPYWRRQHTARELLVLQRSRGERASTASGVAMSEVERERRLMRHASSVVAVESLYMPSSSPRCPYQSSSLPLTPLSMNVSGSLGDRRTSDVFRPVVEAVAESRSDVAETENLFVAGDASRISPSLWPSFEQELLSCIDGVPSSKDSTSPIADADWDEFIALLLEPTDVNL